jgi:hypothetical protein
MKTIFSLLTTCLIFISVSVNAQDKNTVKRANQITDYVSEQMSLDKEHSDFLDKALIEKIDFQKQKTKGKNLTDDEKKAVNKEANHLFKTKLEEKFSKEEIKTIHVHIKEYKAIKKAEKN